MPILQFDFYNKPEARISSNKNKLEKHIENYHISTQCRKSVALETILSGQTFTELLEGIQSACTAPPSSGIEWPNIWKLMTKTKTKESEEQSRIVLHRVSHIEMDFMNWLYQLKTNYYM